MGVIVVSFVWALLLTVLSGPAQATSPVFGYSQPVTADRVLVVKSERRLYLVQNNKIVHSYPIALGRSPIGHKVFQGDGRTPEGLYVLDRRNAGSQFYRSILISYPNAHDLALAQQYGNRPGGLVMIHGQPTYEQNMGYHESRTWDWTEGCIAVSNADMDEIWRSTQEGTLIEVLP
jgi:murein L,D-transpeptidase YafK